METKLMFSSKKQDWATPQYFFDKLNEEFHFTLDPCADDLNHKCEKYYTLEQNGLNQSWSDEVVFCNPPYGRELPKWVKKCYDETETGNCKCAVMLIPARTDTRWFHEYIHHKACEVRFVRGRIKFEGNKYNAPFPSMIVVYWGMRYRY